MVVQNDGSLEVDADDASMPVYELVVIRRRSGYRTCASLQKAEDVYHTFRDRYEKLDREEFLAILLDNKNKLLGYNVVSVGSLTASVVHPREVFKPAVLANAASVLLCHNHPSGVPAPSRDDIEITSRLKKAGDILAIKVLDHIVIGDGRYFSFQEQGML